MWRQGGAARIRGACSIVAASLSPPKRLDHPRRGVPNAVPSALFVCGSSDALEERDESQGAQGRDWGSSGPAGIWFRTVLVSVLVMALTGPGRTRGVAGGPVVLPNHINARALATLLVGEVDTIVPFDIGAFTYPAGDQLSPSGSAPSTALFVAGSCGALTFGIAASVVG